MPGLPKFSISLCNSVVLNFHLVLCVCVCLVLFLELEPVRILVISSAWNDAFRSRLRLCGCAQVCAWVTQFCYLILVQICYLIKIICIWFSVEFTYHPGNAQVHRRAFSASSVPQCQGPRTADSNQYSHYSEAPVLAAELFTLAVTQNCCWSQVDIVCYFRKFLLFFLPPIPGRYRLHKVMF